jgi:hypothetical protein
MTFIAQSPRGTSELRLKLSGVPRLRREESAKLRYLRASMLKDAHLACRLRNFCHAGNSTSCKGKNNHARGNGNARFLRGAAVFYQPRCEVRECRSRQHQSLLRQHSRRRTGPRVLGRHVDRGNYGRHCVRKTVRRRSVEWRAVYGHGELRSWVGLFRLHVIDKHRRRDAGYSFDFRPMPLVRKVLAAFPSGNRHRINAQPGACLGLRKPLLRPPCFEWVRHAPL